MFCTNDFSLQIEEAKRKEKELKKQKAEVEKAAKEAQKRIPPSELFKKETDKYSKFDAKVHNKEVFLNVDCMSDFLIICKGLRYDMLKYDKFPL